VQVADNAVGLDRLINHFLTGATCVSGQRACARGYRARARYARWDDEDGLVRREPCRAELTANVRLWHKAAMPVAFSDVRFRG
jgi:hypothetical protein